MFCHSDTATSRLPPLWQGIVYHTADTCVQKSKIEKGGLLSTIKAILAHNAELIKSKLRDSQGEAETIEHVYKLKKTIQTYAIKQTVS